MPIYYFPHLREKSTCPIMLRFWMTSDWTTEWKNFPDSPDPPETQWSTLAWIFFHVFGVASDHLLFRNPLFYLNNAWANLWKLLTSMLVDDESKQNGSTLASKKPEEQMTRIQEGTIDKSERDGKFLPRVYFHLMLWINVAVILCLL